MRIGLISLLLGCSLVWQTASPTLFFDGDKPQKAAYRKRVAVAEVQTMARESYDITTELNGDEFNVADYAGSFTKTFPHDAETGVVDGTGASSFAQLVHAIATQRQEDFNAIVRYEGASKLTDPQACFACTITGEPAWLIPMPSFPTLGSAEAAANLIEVQLQSVCRDVRFQDYGTGANTDDDGHGGSITAKAAQALTALGDAFKGARTEGGDVTPGLLFRGRSAGDALGYHVSQFLLLNLYPYNQSLLAYKQHMPIAQKREFGVSWNDFVAIENGLVPRAYDLYDFDQEGNRYMITGRDLATAAHRDWPYEEYSNALIILAANNFPLSPTLPYANGAMPNEAPFGTMGAPDVFAMVGAVAKEAFRGAWAHKWLGSRVLRPEAMAGLVHRAKVTSTNPYGLHSTLLSPLDGVDVLDLVNAHNLIQATLEHDALSEEDADTYLMGLVYPEGSPNHPSYPSGHATAAGACITVIKAIFDDTAKMNSHVTPSKPNPADPTVLIALSGEDETEITVGSELDKLASNIALGRNWGGIHYRWDAEEGILLGEAIGLAYLQSAAAEYAEPEFTGFELTKRNGVRVRVTKDAVIELIG